MWWMRNSNCKILYNTISRTVSPTCLICACWISHMRLGKMLPPDMQYYIKFGNVNRQSSFSPQRTNTSFWEQTLRMSLQEKVGTFVEQILGCVNLRVNFHLTWKTKIVATLCVEQYSDIMRSREIFDVKDSDSCPENRSLKDENDVLKLTNRCWFTGEMIKDIWS